MKILAIGSSSELSNLVLKKLKKNKLFLITSKKKDKSIFIKNYKEKNITDLCVKLKKKKLKFDRVIFFNGYQKLSTIKFFDLRLYNKINFINLIVPLIFTSNLINNDLIAKRGSFLYIGSIASKLNEIGNAYYSISKNSLERAIKILQIENKNFRFNVLSLGLIKNKMALRLLARLPKKYNKKFLNQKKLIKYFLKLIKSNSINGKIVKYHG